MNMFKSDGTKRRRFISFVNRNLERVLAVNTPQEGRLETTTSEEDIQAITEEQREEHTRRLAAVMTLLKALPKAAVNKVSHNHIVDQIRAAVSGLRIDQIPEAIMEQINEII